MMQTKMEPLWVTTPGRCTEETGRAMARVEIHVQWHAAKTLTSAPHLAVTSANRPTGLRSVTCPNQHWIQYSASTNTWAEVIGRALTVGRQCPRKPCSGMQQRAAACSLPK